MIVSLAITLAIQVLATMAALTVPVLAPEAARTMAVPATLVGVFIALVYAGAMVSTLASGALVISGKRLASRWWLTWSTGRPSISRWRRIS